MLHAWSYTLSGLLVGFLVGMTGVGGGSLMTPLLILLCGIKPQVAVGTDLIYAAITKIVGTALNRHLGTVRWPIVGWLMAGSVPGTALSLLFLHRLASPSGAAPLIHNVLGVSLLLTAPAVVGRPWLRRWSERTVILKPATTRALTVTTGAVLGVMVALSSVGAGAIGIAALVMLYPALSLRMLVATDVAHAVPLALIAGGGHWMEGAVDGAILLRLLAGSVPGIVLGTLCTGKLHEGVQRWFLGALLAGIGLNMLRAG